MSLYLKVVDMPDLLSTSIYYGSVNSHVFQLFEQSETSFLLVYFDACGIHQLKYTSVDRLLDLIGKLFHLPPTGILEVPQDLFSAKDTA